jgi:hypothetical protein
VKIETNQLVLPLLARAPPRPLANEASPLAIAALVNLIVGAPGAPKLEAIVVLDFTIPDSAVSISFAFFFFCRLIFRPFF